MVLRPNLLSIYKSSTEERLLKQINLSDLTTVAYLKDPKGRRQYVFGLFSPSRNFHLQAKSDADAKAWVELIRHEARVDEQEQDIYLGNATAQETSADQSDRERRERDRLSSSSLELLEVPFRCSTRDANVMIANNQRPPAHDIEHYGDEVAVYSDISDDLSQSYAETTFGPLISRKSQTVPKNNAPHSDLMQRFGPVRNDSQGSDFPMDIDEEKEI